MGYDFKKIEKKWHLLQHLKTGRAEVALPLQEKEMRNENSKCSY